jgi:hypothetical protein
MSVSLAVRFEPLSCRIHKKYHILKQLDGRYSLLVEICVERNEEAIGFVCIISDLRISTSWYHVHIPAVLDFSRTRF